MSLKALSIMGSHEKNLPSVKYKLLFFQMGLYRHFKSFMILGARFQLRWYYVEDKDKKL